MTEKSLKTQLALFHSGDSKKAYELFGVSRSEESFVFRVYAPHADSVFVTGSFNEWSDSHPMIRLTDEGVWEAKIPDSEIKAGDLYKFKFYTRDKVIYKSDPYGFRMDNPPHAASIVADIGGYRWRDRGWLEQRIEDTDFYSRPMNIYELHLGSWKRREDGSCLSYREIAEELVPYVKQMGYTHVELMPIAEHPFNGSWGYQVGGFYSPTSRYGEPKELMRFVDIMHGAGIGVIFDWVPAHFVRDEFGLARFDGEPLYEYGDSRKAELAGWGTLRFDLGRAEVRSFLISNALYWIEKYHADGLRVDAVSSMIYLDYDRAPGDWTPNEYGDNRCLEGIDFLQKLNRTVKELHPDVMMIAEESSAWPGVTSNEGQGLGFDLKWNMGWMNDTLWYASTDFKYRPDNHSKLTFPMVYAFNERFVLPISHDEVVHGKRSFLDKMQGDYWCKFAGARAFEVYRMTCPGKKLTFMGSEIGQFREWAHDGQVEWFLLDYESHAKHQFFCSELNDLYLRSPQLWEVDDGWKGYQWIDPDNSKDSIISFRRIAKNGSELTVVINFTPKTYENFFLRTAQAGVYEEIFNSDDEKYGGSGVTNMGVQFESTRDKEFGKYSEGIRLRVPPLGAVILKMTSKKPISRKNAAPRRKRPKKEQK